MSDWDTRTLHREACDRFTQTSSDYADGKKMLDEIVEITECLRRMSSLTEVMVVSCNDSTWNPPISTQIVKNFVMSLLESRRDELRQAFNTRYGKG